MSIFGAPVLITLPAAGTSEVTGIVPVGTNAVVVVCTCNARANFQYPAFSVGLGNASAQMSAMINAAYRDTANAQMGQKSWQPARIGGVAGGGTPAFTLITMSTFSGTTIGLTKAAGTHVDVLCTVYPILASSIPDIVEVTGLASAGTTLNRTGLAFDPGGFICISAGLPSTGTGNTCGLTLGFATGPSAQWGAALGNSNSVSPSDAKSIVNANGFCPYYFNSGNNPALGTYHAIGSVGSGSYTITQPASSAGAKFAVMAIPGSFALLTGDVKATTGTEDTNGAGFNPSSGLFALQSLVTALNTNTEGLSFSLGGGTLASQRVSTIQNPDSLTTPDKITAEAFASAVMRGQDGSGQTSLANIDSWLPDGVRLNWTDADATAGLWAGLLSENIPYDPAPAEYARRITAGYSDNSY